MNAISPISKRSKLGAVEPDSIAPKRPKTLIFGPPGAGKTWASLDFPKVYYFDHEGGADLDHYRAKLKAAGGAYFGPDQGSLDFETVIGQVQALSTERHPYKTMVFDSITKLFNTTITDEAERLGDKDAFGASKKPAVRQMARLVRWVNRADMNAIFICHQKDQWGKDDKGNQSVIGETFDGWEKLAYELHLVLRISKIGQDKGAFRYAHIGKSRLTGFPEGARFDWSYEEFAARYGKDVIEKDVDLVVVASAEQVVEVKRLLAIVKLDDGMVEKWFKAAAVESWEEMDADKIEKVINGLRTKLA